MPIIETIKGVASKVIQRIDKPVQFLTKPREIPKPLATVVSATQPRNIARTIVTTGAGALAMGTSVAGRGIIGAGAGLARQGGALAGKIGTEVKTAFGLSSKVPFRNFAAGTAATLGGAALVEYGISGKFPNLSVRTLAGLAGAKIGGGVGTALGAVRGFTDIGKDIAGRIGQEAKNIPELVNIPNIPNIPSPIFNFTMPDTPQIPQAIGGFSPVGAIAPSFSIDRGGGMDLLPLLLLLGAGAGVGGYLLGRKKRKKKRRKKRKK